MLVVYIYIYIFALVLCIIYKYNIYICQYICVVASDIRQSCTISLKIKKTNINIEYIVSNKYYIILKESKNKPGHSEYLTNMALFVSGILITNLLTVFPNSIF